jgi:hypothetical protein
MKTVLPVAELLVMKPCTPACGHCARYYQPSIPKGFLVCLHYFLIVVDELAAIS